MKRTHPIYKIISLTITVIFTVTTLAQSAPRAEYASEKKLPAQSVSSADMYAQKSAHAMESGISLREPDTVSGTASEQSSRAEDALYTAPLAWRLHVPARFGSAVARWVGSTPDAPTVVLIQDAHCNIEAQQNIRGIIDSLADHRSGDTGSDLSSANSRMRTSEPAKPRVSVFLEGALGPLDVARYRTYGDPAIRDEVCDFFLTRGKLSGAEHAAITTAQDIPFIGVEDKALYVKNFQAFTAITRYKGPLEEEVEEIEAVLSLLRERLYSEELKDFESEYHAFRREEKTFFAYAPDLIARAEALGIDLFEYPNLALYKEVDVREDRIDFQSLETEVNRYLAVLSEALKANADDYARLKRFTDEFSAGRIKSRDYFSYLIKSGQVYKVNLLPFANLFQYSRYLEKFGRIDTRALRFERRRLERAVKETLIKDHSGAALRERDVQELFDLSEQLMFIKALINTRIFNQDMEDFENVRHHIYAKDFADFIMRLAPRENIPYKLSLDIAYLDRVIPKVYDFYSLSRERDRAMVENLLGSRINTDFNKQISTDDPRLSVLVAGGFHTHGIRQELEKRGISYVVISPHITKEQPGQSELYMQRMLGAVDDFDLAVLELMGEVPHEALRVTELPVANSFFARAVTSFLAIMSRFANGFTDNTLEREVFQAGFQLLAAILSAAKAALSQDGVDFATASLSDISAVFARFGVDITELQESEVVQDEVIDLTTAENGRNAILTLVNRGSVLFQIETGRYIRIQKSTSRTATQQTRGEAITPDQVVSKTDQTVVDEEAVLSRRENDLDTAKGRPVEELDIIFVIRKIISRIKERNIAVNQSKIEALENKIKARERACEEKGYTIKDVKPGETYHPGRIDVAPIAEAVLDETMKPGSMKIDIVDRPAIRGPNGYIISKAKITVVRGPAKQQKIGMSLKMAQFLVKQTQEGKPVQAEQLAQAQARIAQEETEQSRAEGQAAVSSDTAIQDALKDSSETQTKQDLKDDVTQKTTQEKNPTLFGFEVEESEVTRYQELKKTEDTALALNLKAGEKRQFALDALRGVGNFDIYPVLLDIFEAEGRRGVSLYLQSEEQTNSNWEIDTTIRALELLYETQQAQQEFENAKAASSQYEAQIKKKYDYSQAASKPTTPGAVIRGGIIGWITNALSGIIARVFNLSPQARYRIAVTWVAPIVETVIFAAPTIFLGPVGSLQSALALVWGSAGFALAHTNLASLNRFRIALLTFSQDSAQGREDARTELKKAMMSVVDWRAVAVVAIGNMASSFGLAGLVGAALIHLGTNMIRFRTAEVYNISGVFKRLRNEETLQDLSDAELEACLVEVIKAIEDDYESLEDYAKAIQSNIQKKIQEKYTDKEVHKQLGKGIMYTLMLSSGLRVDSENLNERVAGARIRLQNGLTDRSVRAAPLDAALALSKDILNPSARSFELNKFSGKVLGLLQELTLATAFNEKDLRKTFEKVEQLIAGLPANIRNTLTDEINVLRFDEKDLDATHTQLRTFLSQHSSVFNTTEVNGLLRELLNEKNLRKTFEKVEQLIAVLPIDVQDALTDKINGLRFDATDMNATHTQLRTFLSQLGRELSTKMESAQTAKGSFFETFREFIGRKENGVSEETVKKVLLIFGIDLAQKEEELKQENNDLEKERERLATLSEEQKAEASNIQQKIKAHEAAIEKHKAEIAGHYNFFIDRFLSSVYRTDIGALKKRASEATNAEEVETILALLEGLDYLERAEAFNAREYDPDLSQVEGLLSIVKVLRANPALSRYHSARAEEIYQKMNAQREKEITHRKQLARLNRGFIAIRRAINTHMHDITKKVNQHVLPVADDTMSPEERAAIAAERTQITRELRLAPIFRALIGIKEKSDVVDKELEMRRADLERDIKTVTETLRFARAQYDRASNETERADYAQLAEWAEKEIARLELEAGEYIAILEDDMQTLTEERARLEDLLAVVKDDAELDALLGQDSLTDAELTRARSKIAAHSADYGEKLSTALGKTVQKYRSTVAEDGTAMMFSKADVYASPAAQKRMQDILTAEAQALKSSGEVLTGERLNRSIALAEYSYMAYKGFNRARRGQLTAVMLLLQQSKKDPEKYAREIAQLPTGQGKTAVTAMVSFVQSLTGRGVFAISTTDFLANEGYVEASKAYALTGTSVGFVGTQMSESEKKVAYATDITYVAIGTLSHDIATDQYSSDSTLFEGRDYSRSYAVVDEIDSVGVFQAKTKFIRSDGEGTISESERMLRQKIQALINGPATQLRIVNQKYELVNKQEMKDQQPDAVQDRYDVVVFESGQHIITKKGREELSSQLNDLIGQLSPRALSRIKDDLGFFDAESDQQIKQKLMETLLEYCDAAITANFIEQENVGYIVVKDARGNPVEIVLMDLNTGVKQDNMRRRGGIHKALEAKHAAPIKGDSETLNSIAVSDLFNRFLYGVSGMTGTAESVKGIFKKLYDMAVSVVPQDTVSRRIDLARESYETDFEMRNAIVDGAVTNLLNGDSTLVINQSREENNAIKRLLASRLNMKLTRDMLAHAGYAVEFFHGQMAMGSVTRGEEIAVDSATGEVPMGALNANTIIRITNKHTGESFEIDTYDGETSKALEKRIIQENSGKAGAITLATNVGGRGSDYQLKDATKQRGLRVFLNGIAENIGIDQQAKGRTARQDKSGLTRQFLSLERDGDFILQAFQRPVGSTFKDLFKPELIILRIISLFWRTLGIFMVYHSPTDSWFTRFAFQQAQNRHTRLLEFSLTSNISYDEIETNMQQRLRQVKDQQEKYHLYGFSDQNISDEMRQFFVGLLRESILTLQQNGAITFDGELFSSDSRLSDVSKAISQLTKAEKKTLQREIEKKVRARFSDVAVRRDILQLFDQVLNRPALTQTELILATQDLIRDRLESHVRGGTDTEQILKPVMSTEEKEVLAAYIFQIFGVRISMDQALAAEQGIETELLSVETMLDRLSYAIAKAYSHAQFESIGNAATGRYFSKLETIRSKPLKEFKKSANAFLEECEQEIVSQLEKLRTENKFEEFILAEIAEQAQKRTKQIKDMQSRSANAEEQNMREQGDTETLHTVQLRDDERAESVGVALWRSVRDNRRLGSTYQDMRGVTGTAAHSDAGAQSVTDSERIAARERRLAAEAEQQIERIGNALNPLSREQQDAVAQSAARSDGKKSYTLAMKNKKLTVMADGDEKVFEVTIADDDQEALLRQVISSDETLAERIAEQGGAAFADVLRAGDDYYFFALDPRGTIFIERIGPDVSREFVRRLRQFNDEHKEPTDQMERLMRQMKKDKASQMRLTEKGVIEIGEVSYDADAVKPGVVISASTLGETVTVESGVMIEGSVIKDGTVQTGAYLKNVVSTGNDLHVGANARLLSVDNHNDGLHIGDTVVAENVYTRDPGYRLERPIKAGDRLRGAFRKGSYRVDHMTDAEAKEKVYEKKPPFLLRWWYNWREKKAIERLREKQSTVQVKAALPHEYVLSDVGADVSRAVMDGDLTRARTLWGDDTYGLSGLPYRTVRAAVRARDITIITRALAKKATQHIERGMRHILSGADAAGEAEKGFSAAETMLKNALFFSDEYGDDERESFLQLGRVEQARARLYFDRQKGRAHLDSAEEYLRHARVIDPEGPRLERAAQLIRDAKKMQSQVPDAARSISRNSSGSIWKALLAKALYAHPDPPKTLALAGRIFLWGTFFVSLTTILGSTGIFISEIYQFIVASFMASAPSTTVAEPVAAASVSFMGYISPVLAWMKGLTFGAYFNLSGFYAWGANAFQALAGLVFPVVKGRLFKRSPEAASSKPRMFDVSGLFSALYEKTVRPLLPFLSQRQRFNRMYASLDETSDSLDERRDIVVSRLLASYAGGRWNILQRFRFFDPVRRAFAEKAAMLQEIQTIEKDMQGLRRSLDSITESVEKKKVEDQIAERTAERTRVQSELAEQSREIETVLSRIYPSLYRTYIAVGMVDDMLKDTKEQDATVSWEAVTVQELTDLAREISDRLKSEISVDEVISLVLPAEISSVAVVRGIKEQLDEVGYDVSSLTCGEIALFVRAFESGDSNDRGVIPEMFTIGRAMGSEVSVRDLARLVASRIESGLSVAEIEERMAIVDRESAPLSIEDISALITVQGSAERLTSFLALLRESRPATTIAEAVSLFDPDVSDDRLKAVFPLLVPILSARDAETGAESAPSDAREKEFAAALRILRSAYAPADIARVIDAMGSAGFPASLSMCAALLERRVPIDGISEFFMSMKDVPPGAFRHTRDPEEAAASIAYIIGLKQDGALRNINAREFVARYAAAGFNNYAAVQELFAYLGYALTPQETVGFINLAHASLSQVGLELSDFSLDTIMAVIQKGEKDVRAFLAARTPRKELVQDVQAFEEFQKRNPSARAAAYFSLSAFREHASAAEAADPQAALDPERNENAGVLRDAIKTQLITRLALVMPLRYFDDAAIEAFIDAVPDQTEKAARTLPVVYSAFTAYKNRLHAAASSGNGHGADAQSAIYGQLSAIAEEIFSDESLTDSERSELLALVVTFRDGLSIDTDTAPAVQDVFALISRAVKARIESARLKHDAPDIPITCFFNIGLLSEVYHSDTTPNKIFLRSMLQNVSELNDILAQMDVHVQPFYFDGHVDDGLRALFEDQKLSGMAPVKVSDLDTGGIEGAFAVISTDESALDKANMAVLNERFSDQKTIPIMIKREAFQPRVVGRSVQMLTLDVFFTRLATFFAENDITRAEITEDFLAKANATYSFVEPIYITVSDDIAEQIKLEAFGVAA